MLPSEIKCLSCAHCTIEKTGSLTCESYGGKRIPKEIVMSGPRKNCGELKFQKISKFGLAKRKEFLEARAREQS